MIYSAQGVVGIGSSMGGPAALARIVPLLPADFPVPVLIVQHMPPQFTKLLASQLNDSSVLRVREAVDGAALEPGDVWIAPGDFHMTLARHRGGGGRAHIRLHQGPAENSCRPAVDVLFASMASIFGGRALAAVLTGMGQDGRRGAALLKAMGAPVLAQDEASSVVWGMPGSVVGAGLADAILPLDAIASEIIARVAREAECRR